MNETETENIYKSLGIYSETFPNNAKPITDLAYMNWVKSYKGKWYTTKEVFPVTDKKRREIIKAMLRRNIVYLINNKVILGYNDINSKWGINVFIDGEPQVLWTDIFQEVLSLVVQNLPE